MPRGREPSWAMKTAIWDLASKEGPKLEAILRDLEHFCRHDMPLEGEIVPDSRTVKAVIKELQELKVEVLATLPDRVWHLRNDYDDIKDELESVKSGAVKAPAFPASAPEQLEPEERKVSPQAGVWEGLFDLIAQLRDELSHISAKDGAVWQLPDAPWLSSVGSEELPTVLKIRRRRGELKVDLITGEDKRFPLLITRLEAAFPEFRSFRGWKQLLPNFISRCQEICREIWYAAENRTYMKMSQFDPGHGFLANVPLFTYEFALANYETENLPRFQLLPYDAYRLKLTPEGRPEYPPLAVGIREEMMICEQATVFLCNWYTHDSRIGKIKEEEAKVRKEAELFQKVLSQVLNRSVE